MTRVDDWASNVYSQDGEDGCIEHIFIRIGHGSRLAVEFGAGDGVQGSNTARLWRDQDWVAHLIESDATRFQSLCRATVDDSNVQTHRELILPTGPSSISALLTRWGVTGIVDFMSIDVDGNDYAILAELRCHPRVICVEFNPTVPPHISLRQSKLDEFFGASLLAIAELAPRIGYRFIGATRCNAFLVTETEAAAFEAYEMDPAVLCPPDRYTYAVTDFAGRVTLCGTPLPWGSRQPYVLPLVADTDVFPVANNVEYIRTGFESVWGPAAWYIPADFAAQTKELQANHLGYVLSAAPRLVCFDMTNDAPETIEFYTEQAERFGYRPLLVGRVLGLIREAQ